MLCREFSTGSCRYGSECKFAHGDADLQVKLARVAEEKLKKQAAQRGVCNIYAERGTCSYGDNCRFAHVTGDEAVLVMKQNEERKNKILARKLRRDKQRKSVNSIDLLDNTSGDYIDYQSLSFREIVSAKVRSLPQYGSYSDLFDQTIEIMVNWQVRFAGDPRVWTRIAKGGGTRMIKELVESVPVIDRVVRHVQSSTRKVTVVDLCSGFGFLSMFLSDLLPPEKVHKILMIDKGWSRTALSVAAASNQASEALCSETEAHTRAAEEDRLCADDGEGEGDVVSRKEGRDYISSDHFTGGWVV